MILGNLISGSYASSKPSLYILKFSVHILPKSSLEDFVPYFASMWDEYNCSEYVLAYTYVFKCITLVVSLYVMSIKLDRNMFMKEAKWLIYFININIH